jgi:hypothetical protein
MKKRIHTETANRRLMWHGMLLFLLGLLTGFAEPHFSKSNGALVLLAGVQGPPPGQPMV